MTTLNRLAVICFLVLIGWPISPAYAAIHNLGVLGHTYAIVEADAIQELKNRAAVIDWHKVFSPEKTRKTIMDYKPDTVDLPPTRENKHRLVDISYSLEFDIPDGKGGILYPRGYTFNPLEYVHFTRKLVLINGDDPRQVDWLLNSDYVKAYDSLVLITDGSYYELSQKLDRPVYYVTARIIKRLHLQAVPCVARQTGKYMEINEIALPKDQ